MKTSRSSRPVMIWLFVGVGMIIIQVMLGGITRLTGSGLSITEWNLATGSLPPLNEKDWMLAFEKYKQTTQFRELNSGFTLPDFKFIFFWEWFHRLWGRLIGVVFAIPFIIFLIQKRFRQEMVIPLIILFLLGALQGAVGWIMVASGLTGDAVYVQPTKLAMHFVLALILLAYTYWFALKFSVKRDSIVFCKEMKTFTWVLLIVVFAQLFYGAMMAGYKAAVFAPTWPTINGEWIPKQLTTGMDASASVADQKVFAVRKAVITTQFIHRMIAYLLALLIVVWTAFAFRINSTATFKKARLIPLFFVLIQVILGIRAVQTSKGIRAYKWGEFEWMAQLHQLTGLGLMLSIIYMLFLLTPQQKLNS